MDAGEQRRNPSSLRQGSVLGILNPDQRRETGLDTELVRGDRNANPDHGVGGKQGVQG